MIKSGIALLGTAALLLGAATARQEREKEFSTLFCPNSWAFLTAEGSADANGNCSACGKRALLVEAKTLSWLWCPEHDAWHRRPCDQGHFRKTWETANATAMIVSPGDERMTEFAYCPKCAAFPEYGKVRQDRCPECKFPLVAALAMEPTWFWCEHRRAWEEHPCPENSARKCCSPRTGTLLVQVRSW